MNEKEWQKGKRKDIALLVVGLVGTLLGSVLIYYLWDIGWFYHLSVESALPCGRQYGEYRKGNHCYGLSNTG